MNEPCEEKRKALIYCRVSDKKQKTDGSGLDSQEHRCRQHAMDRGYEVEAVFPDDISGGGNFMQRPGMVALLRHMDKNPHKNYVVIFDDLKRYARDAEFHLTLRRIMMERGAERECLNFNFDYSPEGKFWETIVAAQGELERTQNGRQVRQKMRACVEQGYYVLPAPMGYEFVSRPGGGGGKMIAPKEPQASVICEALEGYASGRFQTVVEVQRFLNRHACMPFNSKGVVRLQRVIEMLERPLYAGLITVPKWNIYLLQGKHEPLIAVETWQRIQDRLRGKAVAPARADLREDFPLRNFVHCGCCGHAMTAAWTKGRSKRYPYYFCQNKACSENRKSIRKEKIEGDFEALLRQLMPRPGLFSAAKAMLMKGWAHRAKAVEGRKASAKAEAAKLDAKIEGLMDRLVEADSPALITAYENQIKKLETKRLVMAERLAKGTEILKPFEETYRTAMAFLANPWNLWDSECFDDKRLLLRLAFPRPLQYCRNEGYRTAEIAEPFRLLGAFCAPNSGLVGPEGLEPPT